MKRLWIRRHALANVEDLARRHGFAADLGTVATARNPNDMVVVEVSDDLAAVVAQDGYLMAAGKVLRDGEEPPYVGEEGKDQ